MSNNDMPQLGKAEKLARFFNQLRTERATMHSIYQDVQKWVLDNPTPFTSGLTTSGNRSTGVYNKAGFFHNIRFASHLAGLIAPQEQRWFTIEFEDPSRNSDIEMRRYFDELENMLYSIFANSKFYAKTLEMMQDFTAFGMGALYVEHDNAKKIRFNSVPMRELYIDTDFDGEINTVVRHFAVTEGAMRERFGRIEGRGGKGGDTKVECLHVVMPNPSRSSKEQRLPQDKDFVSYYISLAGKPVILETKYYSQMPYMIPRWTVLSGEKYARSPATVAIPLIKQLSAQADDMNHGLGLLTVPPYLVHSASIAGVGINVSKGALNVLDVVQGGRLENSIQPLPVSARPDIALTAIQYNDEMLGKMMFSDLTAEDKRAEMSATESSIRQRLRTANMAPQLGRLISDFTTPLISRCISILIENGYFPKPPEDVTNSILIYKSPLAQAQKMQMLDGIMQFMQIAQGFAQFDPSIVNKLSPEEALRIAAISTDVPAAIMKTDEEIKAMQEQQNQQNSQLNEQQVLQNQQIASQTALNSAKAAEIAKSI